MYAAASYLISHPVFIVLSMPIANDHSIGSSEQATRGPHHQAPDRTSSNEYDEILSEKRRKVEKKLPTEKKELARALKRDMKHYEATGNRSDALELLRKALSGIPPTSVEAEVCDKKSSFI